MALSVSLEGVLLFLKEAINFTVEHNSLEWNPPASIPNLVQKCERFFLPSMGHAFVHQCMQDEILRYGQLIGFNMENWIQMPQEDARLYIRKSLRKLMRQIPDEDRFKHLYLIAFVCYLSCYVARKNKLDFMRFIVSESVTYLYTGYKFRKNFKFFQNISNLYNYEHWRIHDRKN
ncbi:uncharacterized protein TNCT_145381 [Trichonephila clavata]|uniref:Uncharacterized protein n=1 Tax=Trichonephila clavata TaxID=2740835 RepID=A0A8X6FU86_TRICU|nr:uncharacterized protein TNCT_145381 [Trichonephila clavata]